MTLDQLVKRNKVRPVAGHLIGVKLRRAEEVETPFGVVTGRTTQSGLVLIAEETPEEALVRDTAVIVVRVGEDPAAWSTRWGNGEVVHETTWARQGIERGVLVFARGVAAAPLGWDSQFVQLRYDDIAGVGVPEGSPLPCVPAPGFVLVKIDEYDDRVGSLYIRTEYAEVLQEGAGQWGTVVSVPVDDAVGGFTVGDRVLFPRYQLTEFIDLDGFRLIPNEDILAKEDV